MVVGPLITVGRRALSRKIPGFEEVRISPPDPTHILGLGMRGRTYWCVHAGRPTTKVWCQVVS